jgi:hypothetical protein
MNAILACRLLVPKEAVDTVDPKNPFFAIMRESPPTMLEVVDSSPPILKLDKALTVPNMIVEPPTLKLPPLANEEIVEKEFSTLIVQALILLIAIAPTTKREPPTYTLLAVEMPPAIFIFSRVLIEPVAKILDVMYSSLPIKAFPRVDRDPPIFTLLSVLMDETAVIEDCVKMAPWAYMVDMTDNPPAIEAEPRVDKLPVNSWPRMKVEAPTAKFPVVDIELPTNKGPAVEMVELVFKTPPIFMFKLLM